MTGRSEKDWREWKWPEWNTAIFVHYFVDEHGDGTAVTRIAMTDEDLRATVGEPDTDPDALRRAFVEALRCSHEELRSRLSSRRYLGTYGAWIPRVPPTFFAYLALTCMVAGGAEGSTMVVSDFRERLNRLMGHLGQPHQPLSELPALWSELARWLDERRAGGAPYRELVLPPPNWMTLIGNSVGLAFPPRGDQRRLVQLLAERGFDKDPPIGPVLRTVHAAVGQFSDRFSQEFADLWRKYAAGDPSFARHVLWSAIRQAAANCRSHRRAASGTTLQLFLVDDDGETELILGASDRDHAPAGLEFVENRIGGDGIRYVVAGRVQEGWSAARAGELLLFGVLRDWAAVRGTALQAAVREGLLLFAPGGSGHFELVPYLPNEGIVRAVATAAKAAALLASIRPSRRPTSRPVGATGWVEMRPFDVVDLTLGASLPPALRDIRSLEPRLVGPSIQLQGGARIDGSFLGFGGALPIVRVPGATQVVLLQVVGDSADARTRECLQLESDTEGNWRFPEAPGLALEGGYFIVARSDAHPLARRKIHFRSRIVAAEFLAPDPIDDWLGDGDSGDLVDAEFIRSVSSLGRDRAMVHGLELGSVTHSRARVGTVDASLRARLLSTRPVLRLDQYEGAIPERPRSADDLPPSDRFTEVLATRSSSRKGVPESEFLEHVGELLGVEGWRLRWDVANGWLETGHFDRLTNRRWRERVYFARRPALDVVSSAGGWLVTLSGLATGEVRARLRRAIEREGATLRLPRAVSPHVPALLQWDFASKDSAIEVARRCALPVTVHDTIDDASPTRTLMDLASERRDVPTGYALTARWDWTAGHRRPINRAPQPLLGPNGFAIDVLGRIDRADQYRISMSGVPRWTSASRNWALLLAYTLAGVPVFDLAGPMQLRRVVTGQIYLPVSLARWATVRSGISPGPLDVGTSQDTYVYPFATKADVDAVVAALWGEVEATGREPAHSPAEQRWLELYAMHRLAAGERALSTPRVVRAIPESRDNARLAALNGGRIAASAAARLRLLLTKKRS